MAWSREQWANWVRSSSPREDALKASGLHREKVVGQGGLLDSTRYRTFISWEFNASVKDVHAWVLGGHTEATMVPIVSQSTVAGVPLSQLGSQEQIQRLVQRTRP